jgi:outer membrane receptor protein involved in Fe transport
VSPSLIGGPTVEVTNNQGLYRYDRLPIGTYQFTFSLQGFGRITREGVRVELGRTIDLDVTMGLSSVEESLTVSAAAPVVDSLHAGTSTNFSQALLEEIPSARTSWFNTVGFAPAVRADLENFGSATFLMYGSNSDQNSYQIEGIDYSTPTGGIYMRPNPDATSELQIKAVGASAEEAGFQGGLINEVLRSATNQWSGRVAYFYIGRDLVGNNTPNEPNPFAINYLSDFTAQYGGPIIKDRLWVNGMFERFDNHQVQVGVPLDRGPKSRRTKPTVKVNAKLSTNNTVDFAYTDSYHDAAPTTSLLRPFETFNTDHGHNPVFAATWARTIGTRTVFEMKGGGIWLAFKPGPPRSFDYVTPGRMDVGTGVFSVNARTGNTTQFTNNRITASLTHFTDRFITGSHDLKFGTQIAPNNWNLSAAAMIGGRYYTDRNGQPFRVEEQDPAVQIGRVRGVGVYVQDNWQLTSRVTLNLGVRYDGYRGDVPEVDQYDARSEKTGVKFPGVSDVLRFNEVSPRLGMTFKLDSQGKTVAKSSYGRYFGRMHTSLFDSISPGNQPTVTYNFNPVTGLYDQFQSSVDPRANYGIDPNLKNQYTDQFYLGVERQLAPGFGVDVSMVIKKEKNFIRVEDLTGEYVAQPYVDTFQGRTQTLTVYNRVSPSAQSRFTTVNRDDFKQDFKSVVVQVNKRMTDFWQLLGSYQWERSYGENNGAIAIGSQVFSNTGPNGFGRDPNDLTNAYGPQYSNSAHVIRAAANVQLPAAFSIGVQEAFETGRPYGRIVTITNLGQGTRDILAEPRGAYRLPSTNNLQARVAKDFRMGTRRVRLSVDIYNIFNADSALTVRNNSTQRPELFGQVLSVFTPRRAQLGIRYEF